MPDEKIHNPTVTQHLTQGQRKDCTRECSEMGKVTASIRHIMIFNIIFGLIFVAFGLWATVMIVATDVAVGNLTKRVDLHRTEINEIKRHDETVPHIHRDGYDEQSRTN